jgi:hypothetical protein
LEKAKRSLTSLLTAADTSNDPSSLGYVRYKTSLDVRRTVSDPVFLSDHVKAHKGLVIDALALTLEKEISDLNFKATLNAEQIFELAGMLLDKWRFETLEDVVLAFYKFKQGALSVKINSMYKFSVADAWLIFDAYITEIKAEERENFNRNKYKLVPDEETTNAIPNEELAKKARRLIADMTERKHKRAEARKPVVKPSNLTSMKYLIMEIKEKFANVAPENVDAVIKTYKESDRPLVKQILGELGYERFRQSDSTGKGEDPNKAI